MVNWDGVKSSSRPKGDHVTHLWSWIQKSSAKSSILKYSYVDDIIEDGSMMWI
jgi:hypothetical protein